MRRLIFSIGLTLTAMICVFAARLDKSWAKVDPPNRQASPIPDLEDWKYPGARIGSSGSGFGSGSNGRGEKRSVRSSHVKMFTKDEFKKVVDYYMTKADFPKPNENLLERMNRASGKSAETTGGSAFFVVDDSADRPVKIKVLAKHSGNVSLLLVISRADGEKETHIIWNRKESTP